MLGACYVKSSVLGVTCLCKIWKEVSPPEPLRLQENHEHSLTKLPPKGMRRELSMPLSSQPQHHKTHLYSFHSLHTVPLSALPAFTCYDIHQVDLCSLGRSSLQPRKGHQGYIAPLLFFLFLSRRCFYECSIPTSLPMTCGVFTQMFWNKHCPFYPKMCIMTPCPQ